MLANRVRKNARALRPWAAREQITAYRVFDRDIPELPLLIDWYDGRLHAAELAPTGGGIGPDQAEFVDALVAAAAEALAVPAHRVVLKRRERKKGGTAHDVVPVRSERFVVLEHGMQFGVELAGHLDTGLFLDHRTTRQMVKAESAGKSVLNLFSYTGSFTVAAATGGARATTSVDLSHAYCAWAQDNLALNAAAGSQHRIVEGDVFAFLDDARARGERFDLVVLDPPTVSKSKRMQGDLDVQRDHPRLVQAALAVLPPGGVLYFSTNSRGFRFEARAAVGARAEDITARTIPRDFQDPRAHLAWRIVRDRRR